MMRSFIDSRGAREMLVERMRGRHREAEEATTDIYRRHVFSEMKEHATAPVHIVVT
jgi:hypothetical protein